MDSKETEEDTIDFVSGPEPLTLRDYFAGCALTGMLADHETDPEWPDAAKTSYGYADAMLAERGDSEGGLRP